MRVGSYDVFQFSIWDAVLLLGAGAAGVVFQFSIWDAGGDLWTPTTPCTKTFNSLFEMRRRDWRARWRYCNVLSILYLRCSTTTGKNVVFWSWCFLSILYLRCCACSYMRVVRQAHASFNSLFEMRDVNSSSIVLTLYVLSILYLRCWRV